MKYKKITKVSKNLRQKVANADDKKIAKKIFVSPDERQKNNW